mgnify:CR=1 FL=1
MATDKYACPNTAPGAVSFIPITTDKELEPGHNLISILLEAAPIPLTQGDIIIVTHKAVAKTEGRLVKLSQVQPSPLALSYGKRYNKDARLVELVLQESAAIVRMSRGCLATEYLPGLRAHLSAYGSADEHHALVVASLARRFLDRDLRFFGSWRTVAGQLHPRWRDRR